MTDEVEIEKEVPSIAEEEIPIREMILHTLQIYPVISPTMLQNALGPWLKAGLWRPELEKLIQEGIVEQTLETKQTPKGRHITYKKLSLKAGVIIQHMEIQAHGAQREQSTAI
jgi:hypothetical protein